jgi:hypothetical protein
VNITAAGTIGIGTTNPQSILHVYRRLNAGTSSIDIDNDGSGNGTGQALQFRYGSAGVLGGVYHQLGATDWFLRFKIWSNAAEVERVTIDGGTGDVGIGITTPAHLLQLGADDAFKPATNTWGIVSDIRTKRSVEPLEGGLTIVDRLTPIVAEYNGKAGTPEGTRVVSFEPKRLREVLPYAVSSITGKLDPDDEEETEILGVNTHEILFHVILAVQQLARRIAQLEPRQT